MLKKTQITVSTDRKFSLSQIRNIGFINSSETFGSSILYDAIASYDPEPPAAIDWMTDEADVNFIYPSQIITVSIPSGGINYKYNLFNDTVIEKHLFPYAADSVITVFPFHSVGRTDSRWQKFLDLREKYQMPGMIILEGNDQVSPADFFKEIEKAGKKYRINTVPLTVPVDETGFADIIEQKFFQYDGKGGLYESPVPKIFSETLHDAYLTVTAAVAEEHEEIMQCFLGNQLPAKDVLRKALRESVIAGNIVPVLFVKPYHSRHNFSVVYGPELILDAIVNYLPSPEDVSGKWKEHAKKAGIRYCCDDGTFSAFVFSHDPGTACFRVLSGTLDKAVPVINSKTGKDIFFSDIPVIFSGDIGIAFRENYDHFRELRGACRYPESYFDISSENHFKFGVGDILCCKTSSVRLSLPEPPPAAECAVTLPFSNRKEYNSLVEQLECMKLNISSLFFISNDLTGKITAAAAWDKIGELRSMFEVEPEVFYREKLNNSTVCKAENGICVLEFEPVDRNGITIADCTEAQNVPQSSLIALREGILEAVFSVQIPEHYPLDDFRVNILECSPEADDTKDADFKKAGFDCMKSAAEKVGTKLQEPIAEIKIRSEKETLADCMMSLCNCRGSVSDIGEENGKSVICGVVPFSELDALTKTLRSHRFTAPDITGTYFQSVPRALSEKMKKN